MPVAPAVQMNPFPENWELLEFSEAEPQLADPGGVLVQAHDVIADIGEARPGHQSDIAGSEDGEFHWTL